MTTTYTDIMTMGSGGYQLSDAIRALYSADLEFTALPLLYFDTPQFIESKSDFKVDRAQQVTWTIFRYLPPAIGTLSENVDVDGGSFSDFQVSFSVNEYGAAIGVAEKLDLLSYFGPISDIVKRLLAPQMALTLDILARNAFYGSGADAYARWFPGTATSRATVGASDTMTPDLVRKAAYKLGVQRVAPIGGSYVCVCHDADLYELRGSQAWKDAQLYAGSTRIFNGEEGMIYGTRFVKADMARLPNGGAQTAQTTLSANASAGASQITVADTTGLAAGDEVTIRSSAGAPDGTDPDEEHVVLSAVNAGTGVCTLKTKLLLKHDSGSYVTEGRDIYPALFLGNDRPVGKAVVLAPEVRVALPTDKLRRIHYVGWYGLLGFGVLRNWTYGLVELAGSMGSAPVHPF